MTHFLRVAAMALVIAICFSGRAQAGSAQSRAKESATHSTRIILLGTGSGPLVKKFRSQPANLLVVDGKPYLIDAGDGVARQLAWAGFMPHEIDRIFITHHHVDHNAGLSPLVGFIWIYKVQNPSKTPPVQLYGPPATKSLLDASLDFLRVSERIFNTAGHMVPAKSLFEAHDITQDGVVYQDNKVRVTAVENSHYHPVPGSATAIAGDKSYSYRFDTPGRSVVFTGDTGPSDAVTKLAEGADVLVSEVIDQDAQAAYMRESMRLTQAVAEDTARHNLTEHLTAEELGKMAATARVGTVILTHLAPGLDTETDASRYMAGVRKYFSGPVIAGRDLFEY